MEPIVYAMSGSSELIHDEILHPDVQLPFWFHNDTKDYGVLHLGKRLAGKIFIMQDTDVSYHI
jgi:hypothetical protein